MRDRIKGRIEGAVLVLLLIVGWGAWGYWVELPEIRRARLIREDQAAHPREVPARAIDSGCASKLDAAYFSSELPDERGAEMREVRPKYPEFGAALSACSQPYPGVAVSVKEGK